MPSRPSQPKLWRTCSGWRCGRAKKAWHWDGSAMLWICLSSVRSYVAWLRQAHRRRYPCVRERGSTTWSDSGRRRASNTLSPSIAFDVTSWMLSIVYMPFWSQLPSHPPLLPPIDVPNTDVMPLQQTRLPPPFGIRPSIINRAPSVITWTRRSGSIPRAAN